MSLLRHVLALGAVLLSACILEDSESDFGEDADTFRPCGGCHWGPPLLNSHGLNGVSVSALDTHGNFYDGWRLIEVYAMSDRGVAERPVYDVHAVDGVIHGHDDWGTPLSGDDFLHSLWTVELEATGEKEFMEIVRYDYSPTASEYTFTVSNVAGGTVEPKFYTCPEDSDNPHSYSVVVFTDLDVDPDTGRHFQRDNTMYFGCTSAAVGKAAVWGYSPWATDDEMHQTASRTVRADYCGDGRSHTQVGTELQLEDRLNINAFGDATRDTEAFWGPDGAQCIKVPRRVAAEDVHCVDKTLEFCSGDDNFKTWKNALLWSKVGY